MEYAPQPPFLEYKSTTRPEISARKISQGEPTLKVGEDVDVVGLSHRRVKGFGRRVLFRIALPMVDMSFVVEKYAPAL